MDIPQEFFAEPPVPPLTSPEDAPPIRDEADLTTRWRQLMGPGGFDTRRAWLAWFDAQGHQLPALMPIEDLPARPDPVLLPRLMEVLTGACPVGGSIAVLLSRPGSGAVTDDDRAWARALYAQARDARARAVSVPLWPVHLATFDRVRPLTVDDLGLDLRESA